jgi:hypothetical protein
MLAMNMWGQKLKMKTIPFVVAPKKPKIALTLTKHAHYKMLKKNTKRMQDTLHSWTEQLNTVKSSVSPIVLCSFMQFPIKS